MADAATPDAVETDPPAGSDDPGATGDGNTLAETIREEVTKAVNTILGRGGESDDDATVEDEAVDGVTAPGKTAAERARRGPTREQSVAEETRAELERIRKQEKDDAEKQSLREEIESLKGTVATLAEKPPEQYNCVTKALWG